MITFRRYTTLPFLIDILVEKRVALLDPLLWEDKNDSYFIELYKEKKKLNTVLALCFAEAIETYQHWKIYSGNSSGVCVEFNKGRLLKKISKKEGFTARKIEYRKMADIRKRPPTIDELPFIKRYAFKDEKEYRIVYEDHIDEVNIKYLLITPDDIERVVINPWVNQSIYESIKSTLRKIDGFGELRFRRSTVVENDEWKEFGSSSI